MLTEYQAFAGPGDKVDRLQDGQGMFSTDKADCLGVHLSRGLTGEGGSQEGLQRSQAPGLAREQSGAGEASLQGTSTYGPTQGRNVGCEGHTAWLDSSWTRLGGRRKEQKGHWTRSHRPARALIGS